MASSQMASISPLTMEEEDQLIHVRITNDERPLRRIIKKFHNYTALSHKPIVPSAYPSGSGSIEDAREAFLVELASFQLLLKKNAMICEAEARQVEEYKKERQKIDDEHGTLRGQIEQLKTALEHAQLQRQRKIEYDLVAEKINTLPSREELEQSIQALENDMAAIKAEHDHQSKTIQEQKLSLDRIISDLSSLRFIGRGGEASLSLATTPRETPAPDNGNIENEEGSDVAPSADAQVAVEGEEGEEGEADKPSEGAAGIESSGAREDIEMGEVEEDPKDSSKSKRRSREELEEGEASDTSSPLSDPPDD
ncbi:Tho complex subunit 7 domain containing protein [Amanita muscaria]